MKALVSAGGDDGHNRRSAPERDADEADARAEDDLVSPRRGFEGVEIAAWIDEDLRPRAEQHEGVLWLCRDGAEPRHGAAHGRNPKDEVVHEAIRARLWPEVLPVANHEREHVGGHDPAVVIPHHERCPRRHRLEPSHLDGVVVLEGERERAHPGANELRITPIDLQRPRSTHARERTASRAHGHRTTQSRLLARPDAVTRRRPASLAVRPGSSGPALASSASPRRSSSRGSDRARR